MLVQRIRDAAIWLSLPSLRSQLHKCLEAGLESLLDYQRLAMIATAVKSTNFIEGDAIEFGTFRGGTAGIILQNLKQDKILHVCDSFQGMPQVSPEDNFHKPGDFSGTQEERVFRGLSQLGKNFRQHVGFFSDTIPTMERHGPGVIAFAHIDADLFGSVLEALEFCYPRMNANGIIILDDYGAPSCLGAKQAADEFFASKPEQIVALSQPAHGCVIGGGNLFEVLTSAAKPPMSMGLFRNRIFVR